MENKRNYYRLLHVQFDAPEPVIKGSYRTMMQKMRLHPDLGGDEGNAQLLNQALATLLNPKKRALYDQWLQKHQPESLRHNVRTANTCTDETSTASKASCVTTNKTQSVSIELVQCLFCHRENHLTAVQHGNWTTVECLCRQCGAPLKRVEKLGASATQELRRLHRKSLQTTCEIQVSPESEKVINAQVLDFSVLGISLKHAGRLSNGLNIFIRSAKFNSVAQVRYSKNNKNGLVTSGVEFLTLDLRLSRGELFTASY